jgi:hypothetical protein
LVIDAGAETFRLDFHERLTVIGGVGRMEREGLVNELIGALGNSRSGVHLEMTSDAGNRFAVFRPAGARHRVIDIDSAADVSTRFMARDGSIDLLAKAGLDARGARRVMRITGDDIHTASEHERYIEALANVDQGRLWDVADKVVDRERRLDEEAEATGSAPEDASIVEKIEELHDRAERVREQAELVRTVSLWGAFVAIISAVPVVMAWGPLAGAPFIAAAVFSGIFSLWQYRQVRDAEAAEQEALVQVGANGYLNFHLQRVNKLLTSDQSRKRLMNAAEQHRAALAEWRLIAGDITVEWAQTNRSEIRAAARQSETANRLGVVARATPKVGNEVARDVTSALVAKLAEVRTMGPGGECFPVILDDPFSSVPETAKSGLLEAVLKASSTQQIIFLTEDPAVSSWARVEALTGALAIVEPATAHAEEEVRSHPRMRRHAVA